MTDKRRPFDPATLLEMKIPSRTFSYDSSRTMLYALAVGMGRDPLDRNELRFVTEGALEALPTLATVIGWDEDWLAASGLDLTRVVHGEQRTTLHKPVPPAGAVASAVRITDVFDKGAERGAVLVVETVLTDLADGQALATLHSTIFARGDGGFGGPAGSPPALEPVPEGPPAMRVVQQTRPEQALLYRLLGDRNPLHSDPQFARAAGFDRPILHGLCTFGIAGRAVLQAVCDYDAARIGHFEARFTAPVIPGDEIETQIWPTEQGAGFRALAPARGVVVLDRGRVVLR